jgi:hypothetical protein
MGGLNVSIVPFDVCSLVLLQLSESIELTLMHSTFRFQGRQGTKFWSRRKLPEGSVCETRVDL